MRVSYTHLVYTIFYKDNRLTHNPVTYQIQSNFLVLVAAKITDKTRQTDNEYGNVLFIIRYLLLT